MVLKSSKENWKKGTIQSEGGTPAKRGVQIRESPIRKGVKKQESVLPGRQKGWGVKTTGTGFFFFASGEKRGKKEKKGS